MENCWDEGPGVKMGTTGWAEGMDSCSKEEMGEM